MERRDLCFFQADQSLGDNSVSRLVPEDDWAMLYDKAT